MKLVFLYGSPAAGKLTVARELAALTGWRLFHNHLTVNLALAVYDFGTPGFVALGPIPRSVLRLGGRRQWAENSGERLRLAGSPRRLAEDFGSFGGTPKPARETRALPEPR